MARIFVSYSRINKEFCRRLADEFQKRDMDIWVDWEGIPPTVDWMEEIEKGIEEADTFLAIVSTDWISSKVCIDELEIAVKNGKRLIPVIPQEIIWDDVPPALAQLNFIFFTGNFNFDTQLELLFKALDTDYDWLKTHRRLQVKALEWERGNKDNGFLLRGADLEEAESQIITNANKDPHPTELQHEYVLGSRQASNKQRRNTIGFLTVFIIILLGIITLLVQPYVENAIAISDARDQSPMILVPAGNFEFFLENTSQSIDLREFSIEVHPVTNQVYGLCVKVGKCTPPIGSTSSNGSGNEAEDDPVVWLTIDQASVYCKWVGRKLPSAPQWEYAANRFAQTTQKEPQFIMSEALEWTSSYSDGSSQGISGEWDGQLSTLNIEDWVFLQEQGVVSPPDDLIIYTNPGGAFGANGSLSFRCVSN